MIKDYFKIALKNLRRRKLRSWLTLLGIFISIAIIFVLVSLSLGLQDAVKEQFEILGTDKFFIQPLGGFGPGTTSPRPLTLEDFRVIEKVPGVLKASYMTMASAKVEFKDEIRYFPVIGIDDEGIDLYLKSGSLKIDEGKVMKDNGGEIMIGYNYKYSNVFSEPVRTNSKLIINEKEFKVSAIFAQVGNSQDDKNLIITHENFKELFNSGDRVDFIIVQINEGEDIKEVASRVEKKLLSFRGLNEKTQDFSILTPEELLKSFQNILSIITFFLIGVAGISLLVGAIGIANTMYTSVLERTKEIGVMKAIGARNSDILLIFLFESGLLGLVGGVVGVLIGIGISKTVEIIAVNQLGTNLLKAALPAYLIIGCIAFSFIIGAVSGILPARNASKIKTVDALRYE
jgi:putative ABC transport system permease protein